MRAEQNVDAKFFNPYTEQWTLGVQQALNSHVVAEVRYLGNHGVGLFQLRNGNPALGPLIAAGFGNVIPAGLTPCNTPNTPGFADGYVDCNRTNLLTVGNTGYSNYNGLQTRLSLEHWHGVTAAFTYTFSKDMDNVTEIYNSLTGGNTSAYAQSPFDLSQAERGLSGLDYPNLASVYMIFEVPVFKKQNTLAGKVLGGWQVNPVWRYASGQPYTVIESLHSDYTDFSTPFDTSLCDPEQDSGSTTCRPILANAKAPHRHCRPVSERGGGGLWACRLLHHSAIHEQPGFHACAGQQTKRALDCERLNRREALRHAIRRLRKEPATRRQYQ